LLKGIRGGGGGGGGQILVMAESARYMTYLVRGLSTSSHLGLVRFFVLLETKFAILGSKYNKFFLKKQEKSEKMAKKVEIWQLLVAKCNGFTFFTYFC